MCLRSQRSDQPRAHVGTRSLITLQRMLRECLVWCFGVESNGDGMYHLADLPLRLNSEELGSDDDYGRCTGIMKSTIKNPVRMVPVCEITHSCSSHGCVLRKSPLSLREPSLTDLSVLNQDSQ